MALDLTAYGNQTIQQLDPQKAQPQTKPGVANYISEAGGIAGGLLGSLLGGVGAVGGATGGAALGQLLENKLTGKKDSVLKEALYSGVGEVAGLGLAKGASLALRGLRSGATKAGENIALKGVRATASQQRKFSKQTGQKLTDFVVKNKLFEGGTGQVDELIAPLQKQYDDLAIKSGKKIKSTDLYKAFIGKVDELKSIPNTNTQKMASQLENELSLLTEKFGTKKIPISEITNLRRKVDALINPKAFMSDPIAAGKDKAVRDILKDIIDKTTGQTETLGKQLKELKAFRDIAELQEGLGKGSLPVGLTQLLSLGGFGSLGAGAGFVKEGSASGALKGALLGAGFTAAANNPKVIAYLAKQLIKTGAKEAPEQLTKTAINVGGTLGQTASQGIDRLSSGQAMAEMPQNSLNDTTMAQDEFLSQNDTNIPSGNDLMQNNSQYTKEYFTQAIFNDFTQTGGKNVDKILKVAEFLLPKEDTKAQTATQAQVGGYAKRLQASNKIFDQLEPEVSGQLTSKLSVSRKLPDRLKPDSVKKQEQAERNFINAVLRRESGAAIAPSEYDNATKQYFPQPGDSKAVLAQKRQNRLLVQQNLAQESQGKSTYSENDTVGSLLQQFSQ